MPFEIVRNDITKMQVDAIVNAANTSLKRGGGVCGAIFAAAGSEELAAECDAIGGCQTGEAVLTKGYRLPAKYIIHTAGPVWTGGKSKEEELLYDCYWNSLSLAKKQGLESVAFPLISSGIYGYPKEEALRVATWAIVDFLSKNEMRVYLVVYDKNPLALSEKLFSKIEKYIDDHYVEENFYAREAVGQNYTASIDAMKCESSLEKLVLNLEESFSIALIRLIDEKGLKDVEVYKKANIDRKLFSKIRSDKGYNPSKITVIAFAIALELTKAETLGLLEKAGYTLSHSNKFDLIIAYFIEEKIYDVFLINQTLFSFDQILLGA